jgi:hypothetical protein
LRRYIKEVARQFREIPGLLEGAPGHAPADHARCIQISTDASLREMIAPGILVMMTPLLFGIFLGTDAVAGLLAGRGLHPSSFELDLSRFGHLHMFPLSNRLGENHAPKVSHKMCLR